MPLVRVKPSAHENKTRCHPNGTKLYWFVMECYHGAIIRLEAA